MFGSVKRNKGFVLMAVTAAAISLIGAAGLAIDLGRVYIARNEAQSFVDFGALYGATALDGTADGIAKARNNAQTMPLKWQFNNTAFPTPAVRFSTDGASWDPNPSNPVGIKYIEVISQINNIDLYLIPVVTQILQGSVAARAVAKQTLQTTAAPGQGLGTLPFALFSKAASDVPAGVACGSPNPGTCVLGYKPGDIVTLRWGSNDKSPTCTDDSNPDWVNYVNNVKHSSDRGYIQDTSSSAIRDAILSGNVDYTVTLGSPVDLTGGAKSTQAQSLEDRAATDLPEGRAVCPSDPTFYARGPWTVTNLAGTSFTDTFCFQAYMHLDKNGMANPDHQRNDMRIGVVPIADLNAGNNVVGFAKVFLPLNQDQSGNKPLCAQYMGPSAPAGDNGSGGPPGTTGIPIIRLTE